MWKKLTSMESNKKHYLDSVYDVCAVQSISVIDIIPISTTSLWFLKVRLCAI